MKILETLILKFRTRSPLLIAAADLRSGAATAALLGYAIMVLFQYPGFLYGDSRWQLWQAQNGIFNDWHPPLMALIWQQLLRLPLRPPEAVWFLFQSIIYWAGAYCFATGWYCSQQSAQSAQQSARRATIAVCVLGFFPMTFGHSIHVLKDQFLVAALFLACGMLLKAERQRSAAYLTGSLFFFWVATATRHNSIFAVLPLCVWWVWVLKTHVAPRVGGYLTTVKQTAIAAFIVACSLFIAAERFNHAVSQEHSHPGHQVLLYDIVGIAALAERPELVPDFFHPGAPWTLPELKFMYTPLGNPYFHQSVNGSRAFPRHATAEQSRALWGYWLNAVVQYPYLYTVIRVELFLTTLGLMKPYYHGTFLPMVHGGSDVNAGWNAPWKKFLIDMMEPMQPTFLMTGWFYCLVTFMALFLVGGAPSLRADRMWVVAMGVSGLLYEVAYFPIGISSEARYSWWPLSTAVVLTSYGILRALEARQTERVRARTSFAHSRRDDERTIPPFPANPLTN